MVGRAAVRYAAEGHRDEMVTLVRGTSQGSSPGRSGKRYSCTTGLAPLERVAGGVKTMPGSHLDPSSYFVTREFETYARPLIGGPLPRYERV